MSSGDSDSNSITSLKDIDGADTINQPVSRVRTTGDGDEFVIIGNKNIIVMN